MKDDQSTEDVEREVRVVESDGDTPKSLVADLTANQVAAAGWIIAAGAYGYLVSEYGNMAADTASAAPYPANAWVFMLFGFAVATGLAGVVVSGGDSDE